MAYIYKMDSQETTYVAPPIQIQIQIYLTQGHFYGNSGMFLAQMKT